jgi:hypothetical protein
MVLKFLYPNTSDPANPYVLKNFSLSYIGFITGYNSDVLKNGMVVPGFKYE